MGRKREPDNMPHVRVAQPVSVREMRLRERSFGQKRLPLPEFEDPRERSLTRKSDEHIYRNAPLPKAQY
jgi:hypothetical protein